MKPETFALLGNPTHFLELPTKEPEVTEKYGFTKRSRSHDEVCQEESVKVSSLFVTAKLFDSSGHKHFGPFQQPQVFSASDHRTHIGNLVAEGSIAQGRVG